MDIYINKRGQYFGPYSLEKVHNFLRSGSLSTEDLAWAEGLPSWVPLGAIPGYAVWPSTPGSMLPPIPTAPGPLSTHSSPLVTAGQTTSHPDAHDASIWKKWFGGLAAAGMAVFKFKALFFPVLKTVLSMLFMIWVYSSLFGGWKFAAGFVILIFIHEMGHVLAAWLVGMPVTAPLFIPFVGAMITMTENPRDAWTEALIGYGGPLAGCIGSWICLVVGFGLGSPLMISVASISFLINLFNLIPIPPLDGGRICAAISPWFWILGAILMVMSLIFFQSLVQVAVISIIILFMSWPRIRQTLSQSGTPEMMAYYNTGLGYRLLMAGMFVTLFAALIMGYSLSDLALRPYWPDAGE